MKTMNTNRYGLQYAGPRRVRRGALKQWLIDLVIGAAAMALLWWLFSLVHRAATVGDVMPRLRLAGFPEAVAYGVVAVLVIAVLWRLRVGVMNERQEEEIWRGEDLETVSTTADDRWMDELMAWFSRRHVLLTREQARDIRRICVPDHRMAIVELDGFLKKRMMLRLWVSSLLEVQQICQRSEPETVIVDGGKEGALS